MLDASDVSRMGSRIREALENGVHYAARKGWIERKGDTLQDPEQEALPVRDRSELDGPARDIEHVPSIEIAEAAREIVDASFGIEADELVQQVGRRLGFSRVGSNIQERVGAVIGMMVEQGDLTRNKGQFTLPDPTAPEGNDVSRQ